MQAISTKTNYATPEAAKALEISVTQLRRLVGIRDLEPAEWYEVRVRGVYSQDCPRWSGKDLVALKRTNIYREALKRAEKLRERNAREEAERERRRAEFLRDKEQRKQEVLLQLAGLKPEQLAAASAGSLFHLNRLAKKRWNQNREEIYALKTKAIERLYLDGYCTSVGVHWATREAQCCYRCDGDYPRCWHCDGKGIYRPASRMNFYLFKFRIEGVDYSWHQPESEVQFEVTTTVPPKKWSGTVDRKTVGLSDEDEDRVLLTLQFFLGEVPETTCL